MFVFPSGLPIRRTGTVTTDRLHQDKRWIDADGIALYDNIARLYDPILLRFTTSDLLAENFTDYSSFSYCAGNPLRYIDSDGNAWKPKADENGAPTGYEWIDPSNSYDEQGKILPGLYEQAIFFSATGSNGSFDPDNKYNIGASTATVYKADGTTETFDACTNPSDPNQFSTIPQGRYEAAVGLHKGSYDALRVGDVGTTDFSYNKIILDNSTEPNRQRKTATGINIHKPCVGNITGKDSNNKYISKGCILIDINKWNDFINIF